MKILKGFRSMPCVLLVSLLLACGGGENDDGGAIDAKPEPVVVDPGRLAFVTGLRCTGAQLTGWCWQRPQPDGKATRDVYFADAQFGWVVGDHGTLRRTTDGGVTWADTAVATLARFQQVRFFDSRNGWAATDSGQIWRSQDGGATWQTSNSTGLSGLKLLALGPNTLIANGIRVVLNSFGNPVQKSLSMLSRDGGASWTELLRFVVAIDTDGTLWGYSERPPGVPVAAQSPEISSDLGATWRSAPGYPTPSGPPQITASGFAWVLVSPQQTGPSQLYQRNGIAADWVKREVQPPPGPDEYYNTQVTMAANGNGLMVTHFGQSLRRYARSTNAGLSWTWIDLPALPAGWGNTNTTEHIADGSTILVRFFDTSRVSKPNWLQYLSIDAGLSWRRVFPEDNDVPGYFESSLHRDATGALIANVQERSKRWLRSTDNGLTWRELPGTVYSDYDGEVVGLELNADGSGLAASRSGTLLDTVDGGHLWTDRSTQPFSVVSHFAASADGTYFLIRGYLPYRSADRGRTWTPLSPLPTLGDGPFHTATLSFERVLFADGNLVRVLVAVCGFRFCSAGLYSSSDGGQTWQSGPQIASSIGRANISFISANVAVRTEDSLLQRSTDGGETWINAAAPPVTLGVHRIRFVDAQTGWVVGPDSQVLRTRDGGSSWEAVAVPAASATDPAARFTFADIGFAPGGTHGWIVGAGGVVLATRDGGTTWHVQASGTSTDLTLVQSIDTKTAWVAGANGAILVTATGGRVAP